MQRLEKQIQAELNAMDFDLFLDKEWSPFSGVFYSVKRLMADGIAPLTVVDWREGTHPLPLSMDIVAKVRSQEGDIRESIRDATVANAVRKEKARRDALQAAEDIIEDWQKDRTLGRYSLHTIPKDSHTKQVRPS
jgi:hypothetical protein